LDTRSCETDKRPAKLLVNSQDFLKFVNFICKQQVAAKATEEPVTKEE
jgi:hypothetical protein